MELIKNATMPTPLASPIYKAIGELFVNDYGWTMALAGCALVTATKVVDFVEMLGATAIFCTLGVISFGGTGSMYVTGWTSNSQTAMTLAKSGMLIAAAALLHALQAAKNLCNVMPYVRIMIGDE